MRINKSELNLTRNNTNFRGVADIAAKGAGSLFQLCDDVPMIGVGLTDTVATIAPRTIFDFKQAGAPAGAETLRRESSGLIVNCLIPGAFVLGAGKVINNFYFKDFLGANNKPINLSNSFANSEAISNLVGVWKDYSGITSDIKSLSGAQKEAALQSYSEIKFGAKGFIKDVLRKVEGLSGTNNWVKFSDREDLIEKAATILEPLFDEGRKSKNPITLIKMKSQKNKLLKQAYDVLVQGEYKCKNELGKTVTEVVGNNGGLKASSTLKFNNKAIGSDLKNLIRDSVDIGNVLKSSKDARLNPDLFIKKAGKFASSKSLAGLAVVIPLAMSMQYINRAITRHKYKKSGAPIYKDFEQENRVLTDKEKASLRTGKPFAVASIVGLAALSMGKTFPKSLKEFSQMLQFNTKFPTLNQCRVIATSTFASRMLASEDPNELRESTVRDLASFAGLYFLGDYAEKLAATSIQKFSKAGKSGELQMFNKLKDPSEYKNVMQRFVGWVKDTNIKTFDEIPKEYKNYRSLAKVGGLGFSMVLLGVLLPTYNRHVTNKKEAKRKEYLAAQKKQSNIFDVNKVFSTTNKSKLPITSSLKNNLTFSKISSKFIQ